MSAMAGLVCLAACGGDEVTAPPVAEPETQTRTGQGLVTGFVDEESGAHVWTGVPFAAPPIGELRWRAPRPPRPYDGGRMEAIAHAPRCLQVTNAFDSWYGQEPGRLAGSEDCLYLDIYAPPGASEATAPLPVMMWIHGGSNIWGGADQYDGGHLAVAENVIVVAVQYRLGPMGWFAHGALRAGPETAGDASANFGTLDTIAALAWLRENIAEFGGDPGRITIFGESAGGHNVAALLASPFASGLFHRAIVQSGLFDTERLAVAEGLETEDTPESRNNARAIVERLKASARASEDGSDLPEEGEALGEWLRDRPAAEVFAAYGYAETPGFRIDLPRVIADGVVLPEDGIEAALADPARLNAVPVITGVTLEETKLWSALDPDLVNDWFGIVFREKEPGYYDILAKYESLAWRVRAVDSPARAMTAGGHDAVWTYRFDWDDQGSFLFTDFSNLLGAAHSFEIPFVFGRFEFFGRIDSIVWNDRNEAGRVALSDAMMSYWAEFARTGDPGTGGGVNPLWLPWGGGASGAVAPGSSAEAAATAAGEWPNLMLFDAPSDGGVRMIADEQSWESLARLLAEDPRVPEGRRCAVFDEAVAWGAGLETRRDIFLGGTCR